ncbi:MAG: ABC transporter permease, partial [Allorhizobium sp.]
MTQALSTLFSRTWIWSFIAAASVLLVTIVFTGGASTVGLAQAALTFGAFSVLVGLGQMLVITLGPGNIDLSVPANMTLAATVSLKVMNVENSMILTGLVVAIGVGIAIGIGNYALIKLLRIPPIIATLSM